MSLFTVPSLATQRLKFTRDCLLVEKLDSCLTGSEWTQAVVLRTLALRYRYGCLPGTRGHTFPVKHRGSQDSGQLDSLHRGQI